MTTNRVIISKTLDTVTRAGKQLTLGAATKTELWNRSEAGITTANAEGFKAHRRCLQVQQRLSGGG